ncbi:MAG TPA: tyrosine-type recombinase/integrase [Anaerolineae bacterium]|nr:tyrosine-type recombinase/integrase [Anaerolineae bacterium]
MSHSRKTVLRLQLPELLEEFEGHLAHLELAPATIRSYASDVRGFIRWQQSQHNSVRATSRGTKASNGATQNGHTRGIPQEQDWTLYRRFLIEESGQSPATINRRLQSLRMFGRFLQEKEYADDNPARNLELLPNGHDEAAPRVLDDDEIAQLIVAVRAGARRRLMRRDYAIIELMLQAGLRVNEVASLTQDDLVLTPNGMRLIVRDAAEQHVRQVPLNETLARALRDYIQFRPALPNVTTLFVSQQGKPLATRSIQRLVEEYAQAAQLEDVCANSLRHTCAKKLLDTNAPDKVAEWLGHKNVESLNKYK